MKPRELAGHINRAKRVFVFVPYGFADAEGNAPGCSLQVPKTIAKEIVRDAMEQQVDVDATVKGGEVSIG